jgi:hypothetical protein
MAVQVMEPSRQQGLVDHIAAAKQLPETEREAIKRLAQQLHGERLLPVVGAGASWDCGVRVAAEISRDLYAAYLESADFAMHDSGLSPEDLAGIAEAIYLKTSQSRVVHEVGIPDADLWPSADGLGSHFCVYCVLARMARERLLNEAFGFNYDCGAEAGLHSEGLTSGEAYPGKHWIDRARIVADAQVANNTKRDESSFTLFKANGCAARYRELAALDEPKAAEGIVIRREQLEEWKGSLWSRDKFRDRAANHILILVGFSAQDTKVTTQVRQVLDNVHAQGKPGGKPRVVAFDIEPNTTAIERMVKCGVGGAELGDRVAQISTKGSTVSAALLVLLAELLAIALADDLNESAVQLDEEIDARLATLTISTPTMLRWSYLAAAPQPGALIQRANQVAAGGYVPHTHDQALSVRLIEARQNVRRRLGRNHPESTVEALADHGFIVDGAFAYLPVALPVDELERSCRQGAPLDALRDAMAEHHPQNLECVLVAGDGTRLEGVNLATGKRIDNG